MQNYQIKSLERKSLSFNIAEMVNYQNGKIYKITSPHTDDIYIGSATKINIAYRLGQHKYDHTKHKDGKRKTSTQSFKLFDLGIDDTQITLLEEYPYNSKNELLARERYNIENTPNCMNKVVPTRTSKEYREQNHEKVKQMYKDYHIKNRERVLERQRQYYRDNVEKIRLRVKEYVLKNHEEMIAQKRKEYYEQNKEKILLKQREKSMNGTKEC
jgi:hypothetical protein